jgi:hypothetical protein
MNTWKQSTIDLIANELVSLVKASLEDPDDHEEQEAGSFDRGVFALDDILDSGLFEDLEMKVVDAARDLL